MNKVTRKVSERMQRLAAVVDGAVTETAGQKMGWSLIVFTEGRAQYISNCSRPEVVTAMKELITAWDAGLPDIPAHQID